MSERVANLLSLDTSRVRKGRERSRLKTKTGKPSGKPSKSGSGLVPLIACFGVGLIVGMQGRKPSKSGEELDAEAEKLMDEITDMLDELNRDLTTISKDLE